MCTLRNLGQDTALHFLMLGCLGWRIIKLNQLTQAREHSPHIVAKKKLLFQISAVERKVPCHLIYDYAKGTGQLLWTEIERGFPQHTSASCYFTQKGKTQETKPVGNPVIIHVDRI